MVAAWRFQDVCYLTALQDVSQVGPFLLESLLIQLDLFRSHYGHLREVFWTHKALDTLDRLGVRLS